jgi:predicted  nucleic acid-binding Zn-ribbon protein
VALLKKKFEQAKTEDPDVTNDDDEDSKQEQAAALETPKKETSSGTATSLQAGRLASQDQDQVQAINVTPQGVYKLHKSGQQTITSYTTNTAKKLKKDRKQGRSQMPVPKSSVQLRTSFTKEPPEDQH